jgi:Ni/Fe-hydrogenase subunit HybB-like protein
MNLVNFIKQKLTFWTAVFWIVIAVGLYATVVRYAFGLGASTNLSDTVPWGLWVAFDVVCGVGLAAGGFVVASSVYLFNLERYRPILRPAILTAFLGYIFVVIGLCFDLGKPWNVWHPIIMWNPHSVMFEVGWCVMLYLTVLALEFSPAVFERFKLKFPLKVMHAITIPLVIAGVVLSSLHQSSLGSLFLIMPEKMYPLWYSSTLPYLFFVSSVAVGPAMVIIESYLSSRAFKREIELPILGQLARVTAVALAIYLVLKIEDINNAKLWSVVFTFNNEGILYWAEVVLGVIVPMGLFFSSAVRRSRVWLFVAALMTVCGFIFYRLNVAITAFERYTGGVYFPSWMEISVSLMIVALAFAAFRFAVKYLPIFGEHDGHAPAEASPKPAHTDVVSFIEMPEPSNR